MSRFLAFDIGAESGRALLGEVQGGRLRLDTLHRFPNVPITVAGSLRWDIDGLWREVVHALGLAAGAPLASVGVDTWGCDYVLLDDRGSPVELPYHYRDRRTEGVMARVTAAIGRQRIYETTGVQFLPFNTLFQLASTVSSGSRALSSARTFLTIPDYLNYRLTGEIACEYTNATTTQCVDARTRQWARTLLADAGLPGHIFGRIVEPGTILGELTEASRGPRGTMVVAPACHDTGSAVASVHATGDTAFLSSGTWSLLGTEVPSPIAGARSLALNFTNEGGVCGSTRLLKNIAGLWLLQACRRAWEAEGASFSYDALAAGAAAVAPGVSLIDPDDPTFLNPPDMPDAIATYCRRTGQAVPETPAQFARCIFDSLALKYRLVVEWLEEITGTPIRGIRIIGGGSQNAVLNQLTADVTGRAVVAGPVEATALGNIAMQMLATGAVATLGEARAMIERSFPAARFSPVNTDRWDASYRRFRDYVELACA